MCGSWRDGSQASRPSPDRDELLARTRLRLVEIEAPEELGPPTSMPALADIDLTRPEGRDPGAMPQESISLVRELTKLVDPCYHGARTVGGRVSTASIPA
jgi:hypothetical protein